MVRDQAKGSPVVDDMPTGERTSENRESKVESSTDILELRLPAKAEFLPLVRASAGVIAGGLSFRYDEIVQLRTAIAEAFELTAHHVRDDQGGSATVNITIRFTITADRLEIVIPTIEESTSTVGSQERAESEALLKSLMDEVDLHYETACGPSLRLVKFRPRAEG